MDTRPGVCNEDRHRGCDPRLYVCWQEKVLGPGGRALGSGCYLQYVRNSVGRLSKRTYASGFTSWTIFRRLMGRDQYLRSDADEGINELALVDFPGWCSASQGNQAGTISSKLAAVYSFHIYVRCRV